MSTTFRLLTQQEVCRALVGVLLMMFERFVLLCQSIQLMNAARRFDGYRLPLVPAADQTLSAPIIVHLALTRACNLPCAYGFASAGDPYANELSTDEIKALIDELARLGCFQVSFGGGEPLATVATGIVDVGARGAVSPSGYLLRPPRRPAHRLKALGRSERRP